MVQERITPSPVFFNTMKVKDVDLKYLKKLGDKLIHFSGL